ncbi:unnamed protein product [Leptosia nina]|uniref:Uncharacterized protein n=1 Tax=Leptosia nina TaxID=320188 RepID=A0AAV1JUT3_9NEOP
MCVQESFASYRSGPAGTDNGDAMFTNNGINAPQVVRIAPRPRKPLPSGDERKSVKERCKHFTARGQRARTVADCALIAICGSRPAFVDPRDTLRGRGAFTPSARGKRWGAEIAESDGKLIHGADGITFRRKFSATIRMSSAPNNRERRWRMAGYINGSCIILVNFRL